jgi:hypothetical protein
LQRKSPLSDLSESNENQAFHWKRHGDADDAGAARGRNFSTASLSSWADLNETERSFFAPTRSRSQPSRQCRGQTDECELRLAAPSARPMLQAALTVLQRTFGGAASHSTTTTTAEALLAQAQHVLREQLHGPPHA